MSTPAGEDPGAGYDPFALDPADDTDLTRRQHIAEHVMDLITPGVDPVVRDQALQHVLACDPTRAIGLLANLVVQSANLIETQDGAPAGSLVAGLREALTNAAHERHTAGVTS